MESGWLLGDGDVIASATTPSGWRARFVTPSDLSEQVGAALVTGPAISFGLCAAEVRDDDTVIGISLGHGVRFLPAGRRLVLKREVAERAQRASDVLWRSVT